MIKCFLNVILELDSFISTSHIYPFLTVKIIKKDVMTINISYNYN